MKPIIERVQNRFIFLVDQGYGEWGITTHEILGRILYKYTSIANEIDLEICEYGFSYKLASQDFFIFFTVKLNKRNVFYYLIDNLFHHRIIFKFL